MQVTSGIRDPYCTGCSRSSELPTNEVCLVPLQARADVLVVTKTPLSNRSRTELLEALKGVSFDAELAFTSAIKCVTENEPTRTELKACTPFIDAEIAAIKPQYILALGNEALSVLTGHSGIMKYRGKAITRKDGVVVFPTISPSMIHRNPGYTGGYYADLRFFTRLTKGQLTEEIIPPINQVMSVPDLKRCLAALKTARVMSFDLETNGFDEFRPTSRIISVAFTLEHTDGSVSVWAIALGHRQSPFRVSWKKVFDRLTPLMEPIKKIAAHNGKFDCRWSREFNNHLIVTFDTMLSAHLLDENRPKGLKELGQQLLGAEPWGIDTRELDSIPLDEVLTYNALDTYRTYQLYKKFKAELYKRPRLKNIFTRILMPCSEAFVDIERRGIWIDLEKLATNAKIAQDTLDHINDQIMAYVPDQSEWPANLKEINFNASNFLRWLLFEYLELPIIARGKPTVQNPQGNPSVAEGVLLNLRQEHPIVNHLLERVKWQKYVTSFLTPYQELVDSNSRIHTTFKLAGTVTGRTASGKEDADKVITRVKVRGVNMQQVPRDIFIRGLFGAPPGRRFIEADYSQIELRVAAFMANERVMKHLYATNQDIHMATAMRITGKPKALVTKEERKKAKGVNFGFLYGMGATKFIETAMNNYGLKVTEREAAAYRTAFFQQFPDLLRWHARQRALVQKYGRVESPLGRIRHLPDIFSPNHQVRAEAERQAINSPVQSFASDLALLSLVQLNKEFKRLGLQTFPLGTVHDAINFEAPIDELSTVLPLIKHTMEELPLEEMFGLNFDIPIVSDLKIGQYWGSAEEIDGEIVTNPHLLKAWLDERIAA